MKSNWHYKPNTPHGAASVAPKEGMMEVTERQRKATRRVMERIAELKIKHLGLDDTVDEYIEKVKQKTRGGPTERR